MFNFKSIARLVWSEMLGHFSQQIGANKGTGYDRHDGGDHGLAYIVWGKKSLVDLNADDYNTLRTKEAMAYFAHRYIEGTFPSEDRIRKDSDIYYLYVEMSTWLEDAYNKRLAEAMAELYYEEQSKPSIKPYSE
jgi:hypothetical protein